MLDVTNHVALKYHIQFGVAKCKVIRKWKGKKSKLNGDVLEEVPTYKYLGETINNKGNLFDHIKEVESKIRGATSKIIAETGNKEFKGIKMKAVWQMVDAIIIPIMTYACEGWPLNKQEQTKLQSIFNEALKTILYLPNSTPTTILLNETGNHPIEYIIRKKQVLHAKRIDSMQNESVIKDVWRNTVSTTVIWQLQIECLELDIYTDLVYPSFKGNICRLKYGGKYGYLSFHGTFDMDWEHTVQYVFNDNGHKHPADQYWIHQFKEPF